MIWDSERSGTPAIAPGPDALLDANKTAATV
jgi:hypothetical protein